MSDIVLTAVGGPTARSRAYRGVWLASCASLLIVGAYAALFGPALLPEIMRRTGVGMGNAGAVFTASFGAAIVSTAAAGPALDRFGRRWPLALGLALNGVALVTIPLAGSWPALLTLVALLGLGEGALVVGVHVVVAEASPGREAGALNLLNVGFGVGAVLGPALAAAVRAADGRPTLVLAALGLAQLACAAVVARAAVPARTGTVHEDGRGGTRLRSARLLWLMCALLLIYVGVEVGLGGWVFTYARQAAGLGGTAATLLSGGYWAALTLGRLLSPLVLRRWTAATLLVAGPVLSGAGTLALVLGGDQPAVLVTGVLAAGIGFGPVWPVTFALAARAFPGATSGVSGILAMVSAFGGLGLPWLQGRVLDGGGPAAGISVTLIGCLAMAALALWVRGATKRRWTQIGADERG